MERSVYRLVCAVTAVLVPGWTWAQETALTLEDALQRARERAVVVASARWRVEEARARLRGAKALRDNPVLEGAVGRRSETGLPADLAFGFSQTFELGGRRGGRIAAAEAAVAREVAGADGARTGALREVALAFLRALAAGERVRLGDATRAHAAEVLRIAERRYAAGDVAALDLNLAAGSSARARSEARAAEASEALTKGELKALLGMESESPLVLAGELHPRTAPDLASLLGEAASRPDVRAAEAEVREAEGEVTAGRGMRWPEVTPALRFERDEGAHVLWGGLTMSLPVWNRGQETRGVAEARVSRLRAELESLRRVARVEVRSAYEAHRLRLAALEELGEASSRLEENEALARRSYEVGQIGLAELLLVRRETLEARLQQLARKLEAAESEIELLAKAGVLR